MADLTNGANGRIKISPSTLVQIAIWLVSVLLAYGALSTRVSLVEERVNAVRADMAEIKADVKQLLKRP